MESYTQLYTPNDRGLESLKLSLPTVYKGSENQGTSRLPDDTVGVGTDPRVGGRGVGLGVGRSTSGGVPLFELDKLSGVTEDSHHRGDRVPNSSAHGKQEDAAHSGEVRSVPCLNASWSNPYRSG